jgi:poly-gamma-glutamate synthesis protein (capsule biosynthesis protein)
MGRLEAGSFPSRSYVIATIAMVGLWSIAGLCLSACGSVEASTSSRLPHDGATPSTTDEQEAARGGSRGAAVGPAASAGAVTMAFGGDIHFESFLRTNLEAAPTDMLDPVAEMMAEADIAIVNLESAVTERGAPSVKTYNFRAPPIAFDALRTAGIDVVSMANNHALDFGVEGLEDSLAHAEAASVPLIGIGRNAAEAYEPWSVEIAGQRVAIIAATQVLDNALAASWTATDNQPGVASAREVTVLLDAVERAQVGHDTVVVFLHWGIERETCPSESQLELSDRLVDAGADIIVGSHAHRLQGGGHKGGAFVHYGLGNFVFYKESGPATESGVLLLTVVGRDVVDYEWVPAQLRYGVATRLTGDEAVAAADRWEGLRSCTDLDA